MDLRINREPSAELRTEDDLLCIVRALISPGTVLAPAERLLLDRSDANKSEDTSAIRKLIESGFDPLGESLMRIRSPRARRITGAVYTPPEIVRSMLAWARAQSLPPERIVDPGVATGRFLLSAGRIFTDARLIAIDIDALALLVLRANAAVLELSDRLEIHCDDYRYINLPSISGRTLFIGNPPYVRHHRIDAKGKAWLARTASTLNLKASNLAGLHVHFLLKTKQLAQPGDFGSFITSSEWLDVNYGSVVRKMLTDGLGGTSLQILAPTAMPFDAMTTGVITCFRVGEKSNALKVSSVESLDKLRGLEGGNDVDWTVARKTTRWTSLIRESVRPPDDHMELGELFRVHRGQVTGANRIWVTGGYGGRLPDTLLLPCITSADELFAAGSELANVDHLRRVIDIPRDLEKLEPERRPLVDEFLAWAEREGGNLSYIARHRNPWWSVGLREPAPILCSYMARRSPAFVRNIAQARHINIAHGLYPREQLPDAVLRQMVSYLQRNVSTASGRTYAGGLTKFEPREIERLLIPKLEYLDASV